MFKEVGKITIKREFRKDICEMFNKSEDYDLSCIYEDFYESTYNILTKKTEYDINGHKVDSEY